MGKLKCPGASRAAVGAQVQCRARRVAGAWLPSSGRKTQPMWYDCLDSNLRCREAETQILKVWVAQLWGLGKFNLLEMQVKLMSQT